MTVVDHHEFPNVWLAMWWSLQTVTTVGYGDIVPREAIGRVIGAFIMLEGTAFIAIITAAITSTFVARATRERDAALHKDDVSEEDRVTARFDELDRKLDRLEATLRGPQDA
jgi:voltage-gated potassium channel